MDRDNKIIGAIMAAFAAILLIGYLFFNGEDDDEVLPSKPTPVIPEELKKPKTLSEYN